MQKENIKALLELATSFDVADEVMDKYSDCKTDEEKIEYLMDMFDCKIVGRHIEDVHSDYVALLTTIIGQKWRK